MNKDEAIIAVIGELRCTIEAQNVMLNEQRQTINAQNTTVTTLVAKIVELEQKCQQISTNQG